MLCALFLPHCSILRRKANDCVDDVEVQGLVLEPVFQDCQLWKIGYLVEIVYEASYFLPVWCDRPLAAIAWNFVCALILPANPISDVDFARNVSDIHNIMCLYAILPSCMGCIQLVTK